jgi:hypothetical protein
VNGCRAPRVLNLLYKELDRTRAGLALNLKVSAPLSLLAQASQSLTELPGSLICMHEVVLKAKAVPLHSTEVLWWRADIAPHSGPQH